MYRVSAPAGPCAIRPPSMNETSACALRLSAPLRVPSATIPYEARP
jgi:hypothetical protein